MNIEEIVKDVKTEVKEVVAEVKAEVTKLEQEITDSEKLAIRELENSYLKANAEIARLSQITQGAQKKFTELVEQYTRKYAIDPATYVFDNVTLIFRKR